MNIDLKNAILSMDSYYRGNPNATGILALSDAAGGKIGTDTIISSLSDPSVSYYSIAYQQSDIFDADPDSKSGITIAYRGTDDMALDAIHGWSTGFGLASMPQARLAMTFFNDVTDANAFDRNGPEDITLTGHSLGGGLAGLVGSISGSRSAIFDHMSFGPAAIATVLEENERRAEAANGGSYVSVGSPYLGQVRSYHVEGEVLTGVRNGTYQTLGAGVVDAVASLIGTSLPIIGPVAQAAGGILSAYSLGNAAQTVDMESILSNHAFAAVPFEGSALSIPTKLHSQSLLVISMFGETEMWPGEWQLAAPTVLSHLQDADVDAALGVGAGETSAAIAYSAIDEGVTIFGNVGIGALYDDMYDLGIGMSNWAGSWDWFSDHLGDLSKIAVNFAGRMAVGKVELGYPDDDDGQDDGVQDDDGVMPPDYGDDDSTSLDPSGGAIYAEFDGSYLRIDASRDLWNQGDYARSTAAAPQGQVMISNANHAIAGLSDIHLDMLAMANEGFVSGGNANSVYAELSRQYQRPADEFFDHYTFFRSGSLYGIASVEEHDGLDGVIVGSSVGTTIGTSGDEVFIVEGSTGQTIYGMGGKDMLVGGGGADTLVGAAGSTILGGAGDDTLGAEWGLSAEQSSAGAHIDGGSGYDTLSYSGADAVTVDAVHGTVSIDDRVDTYVNIERIEGGIGDNLFLGNGSTHFSGSIGDDTFIIKVGDWARGNSGVDMVSFEDVVGGISMYAGGIVNTYVPGAAFSRVNDVNVIIGTSEVDHFTGEDFDIFETESLRFVGGAGNDSFDLFDLNSANGGQGADQFYVHLSSYATTVRIEDFHADDSLMVVFGSTTFRLSGNSLSVSFRTDPVGTDGSYNLLEKVSGSSPFSAVMPERYIGHYDASDQIYVKNEATEVVPTTGQHDFFEFDPQSNSGILHLKIDGYGELKVLFDDVDSDDFGLSYDTLPGGDGTRYAGQAFNHADPTSSYSAGQSSFDEALYGHIVSQSYVQDLSDTFMMI